LVFSGVPVGVREGGVIHQKVKEINIKCMKRFIPASVTVDITPLKIGDSVCVSGVKTMENITFTSKPDLVLVSLDSAPAVVENFDSDE
jgi:large subunit ribosomal protein L25